MTKLYYRYGTMNSGKTTMLIQTAYNYEEKGMLPFIMKPLIDTKENEYISSRIGIKRKVDLLIEDKTDIYFFIKNLNQKIDAILVDEAQFLQTKQIDQLLQITCDFNIPVICYGIRLDFQGNGFTGSTRLLEIAHKIEEIKTICQCGKKATFVIRKVNNKPVFTGKKIVIDNNQEIIYESVCAKCYYLTKSKVVK